MVIRGHSIIALKGLNEIAQGNALGSVPKKPSPERAKGIINRLLRPFRACLMGDDYPGLRSASTPGYLISPLRGLRAAFIFQSFPRMRESRDTSCKEWIPAFARMTKARRERPSASSGPGLEGNNTEQEWIPAFARMTKARRGALRQAQGPGFLRSVSLSNWPGILNTHIS